MPYFNSKSFLKTLTLLFSFAFLSVFMSGSLIGCAESKRRLTVGGPNSGGDTDVDTKAKVGADGCTPYTESNFNQSSEANVKSNSVVSKVNLNDVFKREVDQNNLSLFLKGKYRLISLKQEIKLRDKKSNDILNQPLISEVTFETEDNEYKITGDNSTNPNKETIHKMNGIKRNISIPSVLNITGNDGERIVNVKENLIMNFLVEESGNYKLQLVPSIVENKKDSDLNKFEQITSKKSLEDLLNVKEFYDEIHGYNQRTNVTLDRKCNKKPESVVVSILTILKPIDYVPAALATPPATETVTLGLFIEDVDNGDNIYTFSTMIFEKDKTVAELSD
jgi:hypothetical protein